MVDRESLAPDHVIPNVKEEIRLQLRILEDMFGDPGLLSLRAKSPRHPAVRRFDMLAGYLDRGEGLTYPVEEALSQELAGMIIDRSTWAIAPVGVGFWSFIGDGAARRQVEARIRRPDAFEETVAEVFFWSLLRQEGFSVDLIERDGLPDLVFDERSPDPIWGEVKHLRLGSGARRASKVIEKANSQIKRADAEGAGIVFVQVARDPYRAALDDRIPSDVQPFIQEVRRALHIGQYRSVGRVVVTWDDYLVMGAPPERTFFAYRRRSEVIDHPAPRKPVRLPAERTKVGRTVGIWVKWTGSTTQPAPQSLPPLVGRRAVVTQQFRQENASTDGIRASHAIDALANSDALERHELDGLTVLLATRRITVVRVPHTLLIMANQRGAAAPEIIAGYRLYETAPEDAELARHPFAAFTELLRRYGAPVRVGTQIGLFIRAATVPIVEGAPIVATELPGGDPVALTVSKEGHIGLAAGQGAEPVTLLAVCRIVGGNPPAAEVRWAHAVRLGPYRMALER